MHSALTLLQWSIEDITVSSHRGLCTIKTCMNEWLGWLGKSSFFWRLCSYFLHNIMYQRTLSSYYLIVGGWYTRWKFDCTGCIIHTVYISASPCVCLTGIFLTNIVKVESQLVFHLVDCHKASFKLYHRWFLHHTVS